MPETEPEVPYPWWERLPTIPRWDALYGAVRGALGKNASRGPQPDYRLASLAQGAYRECLEVLDYKGRRTGLVVKRAVWPSDLARDGGVFHQDGGNGVECLVYLHVAEHAPDLLHLFPRLYATAPDRTWALHERVHAGSLGEDGSRDLSILLKERTGVEAVDTRVTNLGVRVGTRQTVFLDYGCFRNSRD